MASPSHELVVASPAAVSPAQPAQPAAGGGAAKRARVSEVAFNKLADGLDEGVHQRLGLSPFALAALSFNSHFC